MHFQDFASAFASSDATLTASSVEDINETTLSKACNLPVPESAKSLETVLEHSEGSAEPLQDPTSEFPPCHEHDGHPSELSHNRLDHDITAAPPDYLGNVDDPDLPQLGNHERRPSTSESVRNILDQWKPRVKQYTRQVAGNKTTKSADSRAALPAGMKLQQPKRSDGDRPRSARSQRSFNSHVTDRVDDADLPPVPRLPRADDQSSLRTKEESTRPTTARQVASPDSEQRERENLALLEAFSATGRIPQSEATSEEKQRLLKALQHRQKNAVTATKTKVVQVSGGAPLSATAMGDIPPSLDRDGSNAALATDLPRAEDPGGKTTVAGSASAGASDTTETAMKGSETDRLRVQKRRNGTEDLRIDVAQGHGAPSNVSDDSLLDELQDAQVQKATPITVQASPMTPNLEGTVSRQASNISINPITIRSANSQNTSPNEQLGRTRTVSQMSKASTDTVSIARLGGVSKGISARIQALAENSSRDPSPNSQSRDLLSVGGLPSRPDSRASVASRAGSRPSSPSRSAAPRMPKQWGSMGKSSTSGNDFSQPPRAQTSYSTFSNRGLYRPFSRAETVVPAPAPAMPKLRSVNGVQRDGAKSPHQTRPGSRDSNVTTMTNMTKKSTESGWRFFSRRRGEKNEGSRSPETTVQSLSSASLERVVEDGVPEEKTSRAGRLLKRMSNMSNGSKKNEAAEKASRASKEKNHIQSATASPTPFTLGDLNVQFPDSLVSVARESHRHRCSANSRSALETSMGGDRRKRQHRARCGARQRGIS